MRLRRGEGPAVLPDEGLGIAKLGWRFGGYKGGVYGIWSWRLVAIMGFIIDTP